MSTASQRHLSLTINAAEAAEAASDRVWSNGREDRIGQAGRFLAAAVDEIVDSGYGDCQEIEYQVWRLMNLIRP